PGIPADVARSGQTPAPAAPPQMIAAEEKFAMQQRAMPARVSGSGDGEESGRELDRLDAIDYALGAGLRRKLEPVDDALGLEARRVLVRIGDIVAMRQKNVTDSAHLVEAFCKML